MDAGTAAVFDLRTEFGWVRNDLDTAQRLGSPARTAEVRARVTTGKIVVCRSGDDWGATPSV